jgi:hypothetical protein
VGALQRDARAIRFVTSCDAEAVEIWRYELPGPVLRDRDRREVCAPGEALVGLAIAGDRWIAAILEDGGAHLRPAWGPSNGSHLLAGARELVGIAGGAALAAAFATEGGVEVVALEPGRLEVLATVTLAGASRAQARLDRTRLTICDDLGRVAGVDLETRRVTHVVRVHS